MHGPAAGYAVKRSREFTDVVPVTHLRTVQDVVLDALLTSVPFSPWKLFSPEVLQASEMDTLFGNLEEYKRRGKGASQQLELLKNWVGVILQSYSLCTRAVQSWQWAGVTWLRSLTTLLVTGSLQ